MSINHAIAKVLYRAWSRPKLKTIFFDTRLRIEGIVRNADYRLIKFVERIDDKIPCPECADPTPLVELERTGTCFPCYMAGPPAKDGGS